MKPLRLLALASAFCCCVSSSVLACDHDKATSATNTSNGEKACCAKGSATSATTAAYTKGSGCSADAKAAAAMGCSMHGTSAATAAMDHCMGAKGTKTSAMTAGAQCSRHGTMATAAMASGMKCAAHASAAMAHGDCSSCADWATCEDEVRASGATSQVVPLKNGAMIVYTAETPEGVKAVQAAVARRNDRMIAAQSTGEATKLCPDCRQLRGALASGKMTREVVNVERGCMTLLTSNDRAVVQKIHEMTGSQMAVRN